MTLKFENRSTLPSLKVAGETLLSSWRSLPAAGFYIQPCNPGIRGYRKRMYAIWSEVGKFEISE